MNVIEGYVTTHLENLIPYAQYRPYHNIHVRDFWDGLTSVVRNHYIKEGEQYLSFEWNSVTASSFLKFYRFGDRLSHNNQFFPKRKALGSLILAECMEHKGRFSEQIVNGIWSICEETVWSDCDDCHCDGLPDTRLGHPLDACSLSTANLIAFAYALLGDELDSISKAITRRMKRELYQRTVQPYLKHEGNKWTGYASIPLKDWTPWCTYHALSVILLSCEDEEIRKQALLKGAKSLDVYVKSLPHDGSCEEGPAYWSMSPLRLIEAIDLIQGAIQGEPFVNEKIRNIALFYSRSHIDKEWFLNFGEAFAKAQSSLPYSLYYLGKLLGIPELEGEGAEQFRTNPNPENLQPDYDMGREMMVVSYFDKLLHSTAKAQPIIQAWYPDIQVMVSRETSEYGKGLFLAAKGGHNGESQNHNDIGSFIVFKNGSPIFIDLGRGSHTNHPAQRSVYHNLPIFPEGEQQSGKEFGATKVCYAPSPEKDSLSMDISLAYGLAEDFACREFLFDRENKQITITDRLSQNRPNQWVLMTAERPDIKEKGFTVADCSITLSQGSIAVEPIPLKDPAFTEIWGNMCYRILITADTDQFTLTIK